MNSKQCKRCGGRLMLCAAFINTVQPDEEPFEAGVRETIEEAELDGGEIQTADTISVGCHVCERCHAVDSAWIEEPRQTETDGARKRTSQLSALHAWLESRGLPRDYVLEPGKDVPWRWVSIRVRVDESRGEFGEGVDYIDGTYIGIPYWTGDIRWDRATPAQREAVLALRDGEGSDDRQ